MILWFNLYKTLEFDKNNPNGAAMLKRATAKMQALGALVYEESASRKVGRNTTMGTTIAKKAARGGSNAASFRPKSPSASSLPRSTAKKTTKRHREFRKTIVASREKKTS